MITEYGFSFILGFNYDNLIQTSVKLCLCTLCTSETSWCVCVRKYLVTFFPQRHINYCNTPTSNPVNTVRCPFKEKWPDFADLHSLISSRFYFTSQQPKSAGAARGHDLYHRLETKKILLKQNSNFQHKLLLIHDRTVRSSDVAFECLFGVSSSTQDP